MTRSLRTFALLAGLVLVAGCGDSGPVKLGFIGGVSGRVADLGIGGRNGVTLAIEEQNRNGGIHGRPIELLIEDDQQDPEVALQAVDRLLDSGVVAILGPMTSSIAMTVLPRVNQAKVLMMGITVTTNELSGIDDYFFRTLPPTRIHAGHNAEYNAMQRGIRRVAIAYDLGNRAFTESWKRDFTERLEQLGGEVITTVGFESSNTLDFNALAEQLLTDSPQAVVTISNSLDASLISKALRTQNPEIHLITAEWGATERLLEMGGRYVEGLVSAQFFDRESTSPAFVTFARDYAERFGHPPGYPATTGYNAARIVIESLLAQREDQSLKESLLAIGTFEGLQSPIEFDAYGEVAARTYLTEVRDGRFRMLE